MSDFDNRDALLRMSSFASTHSEEEPTTLAAYVERMKDGQEQIFYATGETREQLLKLAAHGGVQGQGLRGAAAHRPGRRDVGGGGQRIRRQAVPVDRQGRGRSRHRGGEEGRSAPSARSRRRSSPTCSSWLTETLSEHVKEVRLSTRLTESPACLIGDAFGMTPALAADVPGVRAGGSGR